MEGKKEVVIEDPDVKCLNCGWEGKQSDLLVHEKKGPVEGSDVGLEVIKQLSQELFEELYHRISGEVGRALLAVGLFPLEEFKKSDEVKTLVTRLIRAGVIGTLDGILKEMSKIEREKNGTLH